MGSQRMVLFKHSVSFWFEVWILLIETSRVKFICFLNNINSYFSIPFMEMEKWTGFIFFITNTLWYLLLDLSLNFLWQKILLWFSPARVYFVTDIKLNLCSLFVFLLTMLFNFKTLFSPWLIQYLFIYYYIKLL